MAISGRVIEGQQFRKEVFKGETFRRISHCDFENCWFHDCVFDDCLISRTSIVNTKFNVGCSWKRISLLGKCTFEGNNIEIIDCRVGGRGYIAVLNKEGVFIGCEYRPWTKLNIDTKELLKMDKKNSVYWWKVFKPKIEAIVRERGWI